MSWLAAHWMEVAGVAVVVLPALITGLTPYTKAKGVVTALRVVLDILSIVTHKDSPGSLKLPLMRSPEPVVNGVNKPEGGAQ